MDSTSAAEEQAQKVLELGKSLGTTLRNRFKQLLTTAPHPQEDTDDCFDYSKLPSAVTEDHRQLQLGGGSDSNSSSPPLPLGRVPDDVCLNLFGFLGAKDLCSVRASCLDLHHSEDLHADALWAALVRCDFPTAAVATTARSPPTAADASVNMTGTAGRHRHDDHRLSHQVTKRSFMIQQCYQFVRSSRKFSKEHVHLQPFVVSP